MRSSYEEPTHRISLSSVVEDMRIKVYTQRSGESITGDGGVIIAMIGSAVARRSDALRKPKGIHHEPIFSVCSVAAAIALPFPALAETGKGSLSTSERPQFDVAKPAPKATYGLCDAPQNADDFPSKPVPTQTNLDIITTLIENGKAVPKRAKGTIRVHIGNGKCASIDKKA